MSGEPQRRTRFARLYGDGTMSLEPAGTDFLQARHRLCDGHDDPDVELLEVEISVVRTHGSPQIAAVAEPWLNCPTCGEEFTDAVTTETLAQLRRELDGAHAMLRARTSDATLRVLAAELAGALNAVVNAYEGQTFGTLYKMTRALPDARATLAKARAAGVVR